MASIVVRNSNTDRPMLVVVESDYDDGPFLSIVVKDLATEETVLDLSVEEAPTVGELLGVVLSESTKFFSLRG